MAARALSDASISTIILESGSHLANTGAVVKAFFSASNALWQSPDQDQGVFFFVNWVRGATISE